MASRLAKSLTAALLSCLCSLASAAITPVDIFASPGVPGTGGSSTIQGPCYCDQPAVFSPVVLLQPGTYDLGDVREFWVQSGSTPDGGPGQSNLYLLFAPVVAAGSWPYDFPVEPGYAYPATYDLCGQNDAACNARYLGAYQDFDLLITVSPDQNAVQVSLIGNFQYTSPVSEPATLAMLVGGWLLVARRRRHRSR